MSVAGFLSGALDGNPGGLAPRGLRDEALNLLCASRMSSTRGKHASAWRAWRSFCRYAKVARTCYTEGVLVLFVAWLRSVRKVAFGTAKAYLFGVSMFSSSSGRRLR